MTDGVLLSYYGEGGDVVIPDGVTAIGERVFYKNNNVTRVTFPEGLVSIGCLVFYQCSNLTDVRFPSTLDAIGDQAFAGSGLIDLSLPSGITTIREHAFWACDGLTSVTIPGSVTEIAGKTFYGCSNLTDVTIGYGTQGIYYGAFDYCPKLVSLTIPSSVTRIESSLPGLGLSTPHRVLPSMATTTPRRRSGPLRMLGKALSLWPWISHSPLWQRATTTLLPSSGR